MTQKEINEVARSIRRDLDGGLILQRYGKDVQNTFIDLVERYSGWDKALEIAAKKGIISRFERTELVKILNDCYDETVFWLAEAAVEQKEGD